MTPVKPQSDAQRACNSVWIRSQLQDMRRTLALRPVDNAEMIAAIDDVLAGRQRGAAAETDAATSAELRRYRSTRR